MKICHITSVHDYRDTRIMLKECVTLKRISNEVHLIAVNNDSLIEYKGIYVHGIKKTNEKRLTRIIKASKKFYSKAIELDADIYHFHDPELIPLGKKLIKKGKKVIYDIHEDVPRQILTKLWIPSFLRKSIAKIFEIYENYSVKKFTGIITATQHIKKRFENKNNNVIDIKNYPILNELYDSDNINQHSKENSVVYVGGISEKRGIYTILESLLILEEVTLNLAGSINNEEQLNKMKNNKSWPLVDYYGFVGREEVKEILNKSRVGLTVLHPMPSYEDSLPIKMFEYMAVGLPVVASNFPLWERIIKKNNCGICVDPESPEEIARAIKWLMDNPEKAEEMGRNGQKAVQNEYNWESESLRLMEFYNDIEGV